NIISPPFPPSVSCQIILIFSETKKHISLTFCVFLKVDPGNTGRVGPTEAALFLKKSGLPDITLGKIWDLADPDGKGFLDKQGFYVALRLVACAQSGHDISISGLNLPVPPPKFKDHSSPSLSSVTSTNESHWAVRPEEKSKFDGIFESLAPVNGLLSGEKVKPVLINSKLPVDVLGKVWDLSDIDKDGHLDKDEFAVHSVNWVVPVADRGRYDDIFLKTDTDLDGFLSGQEVKEIFMQSGLSQNLLAHIWALADTRQMGKLTREQFSLAMHLIQLKVSKGMDPPQALTPDMIPPSERSTPGPDSSSSVGSGEFSGIKELDDISQEIAHLQREKYTLEQDIRETEEAIRNKTTEVQEMQNDLDRETSTLQELEAQKQDAQDRLEEMDQQKAKLEDMLNDVRQKCQEESQMISSLQSQIHSQESDLQSQEAELGRAKADLNHLQQEEAQLEQSLQAGRIQLETIIKSLKATQDEINQARSKLSQIQDSQHEISKSIEQYSSTLNGTHGGSMTNLADMSEGFPEKENGAFGAVEDPFKVKTTVFNSAPQEMHTDPFQSEDPFKTDPFKGRSCTFFCDPFQNDPFSKQTSTVADPFGGDPFIETDPFRTSSEDFFKKPLSKPDPFSNADPFSKSATLPSKSHNFSSNDPFSSTSPKPKGQDFFGTLDPFGSSSFGSNSGFADFSQMSKVVNTFYTFYFCGFVDDPFSRKQDMPALPPKKSIPPRPKPPSAGLDTQNENCCFSTGKSTPVNVPGSTDSTKTSDPFQPFSADPADPFQSKKGVGDPFSGKDPFAPSASSKASKDSSLGFADFSSFGNEAQQMEWAKRESERAERERLKRLRQQEQEDLELAIALSKAEMSNA
uniref:Epidermal growth factor receptor pathway substrate 15-like 1a n=2 Tax=Cyprinus carpio TaxID=7962 RepID=A0A9J8BL61_CYPCA